ncbi:MAG: DUF2061 domain-containing protein [Candidatus Omnitrophica bacterium]|nr:DUF2061 domain-containing protein [Candidatus Omnitrophota bacterium]MCA9415702.1 DUF2061 domain-containing protein [Candidatus Omnitrophota bacterium]MCA9432796.1 DUF2061 domain-containing protein [Candidatus Omnitrophota bacterium]MCA9447383.1 DUF2061 domain-containing protein [Candidatus Omnitrophota bacterium]MCB9782393.1 DUF2061 domain-containing protein [Candidatus Omnitrophota bacterium]
METHRRSLAKALSWRVFAFLITFVVALAVTGKTELSAGIGLADSLIKVFAYYAHERVWFRIPFGQAKTVEYEI